MYRYRKWNKIVRNKQNIYSSTEPMANSVGAKLNNKFRDNLRMGISTARVLRHFPMGRPIRVNSQTDIFMAKVHILANQPIYHP